MKTNFHRHRLGHHPHDRNVLERLRLRFLLLLRLRLLGVIVLVAVPGLGATLACARAACANNDDCAPGSACVVAAAADGVEGGRCVLLEAPLLAQSSTTAREEDSVDVHLVEDGITLVDVRFDTAPEASAASAGAAGGAGTIVMRPLSVVVTRKPASSAESAP